MSKARATWIGFGLIALVFFALFLFPGLTAKKNFKIDFSGWPEPVRARFPTSLPLTLLVDGKEVRKVSLEGLEKNPEGYIVHYWATWCPPCVEELPSIELLHRQLEQTKTRKPTLVTISVDEKAQEVANFLKTLGGKTTFTILLDPEAETARALGTTRFPESYWIRPDGTVRHKWVGPQTWNSREVLTLLLPRP